MRVRHHACAASRTLHTALADLGHDVVSAREELSYATDEALLALAYEKERVIVTEDKDFGELAFVRRQPHPCILRFSGMRTAEKVSAMRELIEHHGDAMRQGALLVVTPGHVRIRAAGQEGRAGTAVAPRKQG